MSVARVRFGRRPSAGVGVARERGFTLAELLLVVFILSIVAAICAPRIRPMLSGGRVRTGARELAAAGRYARSMALLNQMPVDLVVETGSGKISVVASERMSDTWFGMSDLAAYTNETGYTENLLRTSARRRTSLGSGFGLAVSKEAREAGAETNALAALLAESEAGGGIGPAAEVTMADSIGVEKSLEGVKIVFEGYRDTPGMKRGRFATSRERTDEGTVTVRYRANGTVRAHRWTVANEEDEADALAVTVNGVGRAKIADVSEADE